MSTILNYSVIYWLGLATVVKCSFGTDLLAWCASAGGMPAVVVAPVVLGFCCTILLWMLLPTFQVKIVTSGVAWESEKQK